MANWNYKKRSYNWAHQTLHLGDRLKFSPIHKGKLVEKILQEDAQWLDWLSKDSPGLVGNDVLCIINQQKRENRLTTRFIKYNYSKPCRRHQYDDEITACIGNDFYH